RPSGRRPPVPRLATVPALRRRAAGGRAGTRRGRLPTLPRPRGPARPTRPGLAQHGVAGRGGPTPPPPHRPTPTPRPAPLSRPPPPSGREGPGGRPLARPPPLDRRRPARQRLGGLRHHGLWEGRAPRPAPVRRGRRDARYFPRRATPPRTGRRPDALTRRGAP